MEAEPQHPVKLSCRNLWKIYGLGAERSYEAAGLFSGDKAAVSGRLRREGQVPAVVSASFDVHVGEIFVIMGLSGSGKSTLVRCLSRLVESTHGQVLLDGEDLLAASPRRLTELRRSAMGMVFQHFGLLPHLSVLDNVAFPLRVQGLPARERYAKAKEMIALVGLEGRELSFPHQLSGGQQQRVGIARSLAVGPGLWFLDEPFSALDPLIRKQMQDEFLRLQRKLGKTIVFITHDIQEAFRLADRIAIMRHGEIIQIGRPADILRAPADNYVAQFVEDISLVRELRAADIAVQNDLDGGPCVENVLGTACLEELIARVAQGVTGFQVVSAEGKPQGAIVSQAVLQILQRDRERRH
ncbi:betaine/proline/choline family ABC transporter ATP-binding protein [Mesorhizobium sp. CA7]|nr:betaine/proline/choline family ABC transporter ATP-binding protein [Mesorhizobium sp. CA7]MBZ9813851.1 betaine/proline/choline family ABC transporter ATP-binding protein [Mesorhizobium sp. CA7]